MNYFEKLVTIRKLSINYHKVRKISYFYCITLFFSIDIYSQELKITFPNSGDSLKTNQMHNITWDNINFKGEYIGIYYSMDGGKSWDIISSKTKNNGSFEWDIPAFYDYWPAFRGKGDNCLIKIESSDNPEIFDISEGGFKIYGERSEIRITTRLLNKRYNPGEEMLLEWESKNLMAYEVSFYFSENSGVSWSQIVDITDDDGEISIKIPEIEFTSDNCIIKIEKYEDSSVYDVSNSFTVFGEPSLDITFPNGGNQLQGLRKVNIKWTSRNLKKSRIDVFFTMNGEEQWTTIKMGVSDNGSFTWVVPEITSDKCRIKLVASKLILLSSPHNRLRFFDDSVIFDPIIILS